MIDLIRIDSTVPIEDYIMQNGVRKALSPLVKRIDLNKWKRLQKLKKIEDTNFNNINKVTAEDSQHSSAFRRTAVVAGVTSTPIQAKVPLETSFDKVSSCNNRHGNRLHAGHLA